MPAVLSIDDVSGKVVMVRDIDGAKGMNEISLHRSELQAVGVLYYQLDAAEYSATKRMIIIE